MTKYVGCAIAWAVTGCDEANVISEHSSDTKELHTTYLQQYYVFRAGHDLQTDHMYGVMINEQQDIQHENITSIKQ